LLLIPCVTLAAIGCAESSPTPYVPIVAVAQPSAAANPSTPLDPDVVTDLEWDQLAFDLQDRTQFDRADIPQAIQNLDGALVRVRGYYVASLIYSEQVEQFVMFGEIKSEPIKLDENRDLFAIPLHYLTTVEMADGKTADFTLEPITVVGRFFIKERKVDGKAFCVFNIVADSVVRAERRDGYRRAVYGMIDGC